MGDCRRRSGCARHAGEVLLSLPDRKLYLCCALPSAAPRLFCIASALDFRKCRPCCPGPHLFWLATTGAMPLSYALNEHAGKAFIPALREALLSLLEAASLLVLPACLWAAIARRRLKLLPQDFRDMDPGLVLLLFITVGTIEFPVMTAVVVGTHLPGIWALPGLFLFAVLTVCSTRY